MPKLDIEKIKEYVKNLYRNYGINIGNMSDEEISRICRHYFNNPEELGDDVKKSKEYSDTFDDDDIF